MSEPVSAGPVLQRDLAEELRVARAQLELKLTSIPMALVTLDPQSHALTFVSATIERISGYTQEQWMSTPGLWASRLHPEDAPRAVRERRAGLEQGMSTIEYRWRCADGGTRSFLEQAILVRRADGTPREVAVAWLDVTDHRPAALALRDREDRFRQSQKMEAIGRLAGGVAHDFNNLLTAILGYSDILLEKVGPEFPHRRELEEVRRAGERAAALTHQLLAFSRRQPTNPRMLDLNAVVSEMEPMLRRVIPENVRIDVVHGSGLGSVRADPTQMDQVLMNLALNARDAMPDGGTLTIATSAVDIDATSGQRHPGMRPGRYVILTVSDNGTGIPKELLPNLFEPFFTTKAQGKGTGLGLATVYGIAQQSGGFVTVASVQGRGTTFKVHLPSVADAPDKTGETTVCLNISGKETVLLVDDDGVVRTLVRTCLTTHGYRVIEAADPREAEKLFGTAEAPVDLLLTDMVMPGMSGRELAGRLRARHPHLKVLFMSGYTDESGLHVEQEGIESRMIEKPFRPVQLLTRIRKVLSKSCDDPPKEIGGKDR